MYQAPTEWELVPCVNDKQDSISGTKKFVAESRCKNMDLETYSGWGPGSTQKPTLSRK